MAVTITCPHCGAAGNAPDHIIGQTVRCSKCKQSFVAGGAPSPGAPPPVPVTAGPPSVVEEYDEEPPVRRGSSRRDDDDYDDVPRRRPVRSGAAPLLDFLLFRRMIAPYFVMGLWYLSIVVYLVVGLFTMVFSGQGIMGVLIGMLMMLFGPVLSRLTAELLLVIFRINETLTDIRNMKEDGK
jgi:uncharacterized paraquat-inducible protein A